MYELLKMYTTPSNINSGTLGFVTEYIKGQTEEYEEYIDICTRTGKTYRVGYYKKNIEGAVVQCRDLISEQCSHGNLLYVNQERFYPDGTRYQRMIGIPKCFITHIISSHGRVMKICNYSQMF